MYEPQESAVMALERKLAAHSQEMATAVSLSQLQQQQQQQSDMEGDSGEVAFDGSADGLGRVTTVGRSPREQEMYRVHRLHLLLQRRQRQHQQQQQHHHHQKQKQHQELEQQQRQRQQRQQQQQPRRTGIDQVDLIRLLDGGVSPAALQSNPQQRQQRQRKAQAQASGEREEEKVDKAKTRRELEEEAAVWRGKAEMHLRSYRTLLRQAQTAHQKNMIQAVENASLRRERDEMEQRGLELTKELRETREALVEAKAELTTLKTLHSRKQQQQQQQQQQRQRPSSSYPGSSTPSSSSSPASARQQHQGLTRPDMPSRVERSTPVTTPTRAATPAHRSMATPAASSHAAAPPPQPPQLHQHQHQHQHQRLSSESPSSLAGREREEELRRRRQSRTPTASPAAATTPPPSSPGTPTPATLLPPWTATAFTPAGKPRTPTTSAAAAAAAAAATLPPACATSPVRTMGAPRKHVSRGDNRTRHTASAAEGSGRFLGGKAGVSGAMGGGGDAAAVERTAALPPHDVGRKPASAPSEMGRQRPLGEGGGGGRGSHSRPQTMGTIWREDSFPVGEDGVPRRLGIREWQDWCRQQQRQDRQESQAPSGDDKQRV
eukprot:g17217.t1